MATWSAIIGPAHSNKTGYCWRIGRALALRGFNVQGFLQLEVRDTTGEVLGWDIERFPSEERCSLARPSETPDICSYAFADEGFEQAAEWSHPEHADVILFGAVGKLEAARRGHWPALERAILDPEGAHVVACLRDDCLRPLVLSLPDPSLFLEVPTHERATADFVGSLDHLLREELKHIMPPNSKTA